MPDLDSPNVPALAARVHQHLAAGESAGICLDDLRFRPLCAEDFDEMVQLHLEWFPVSYGRSFYTRSVNGEIISLAATRAVQQPGAGSSSSSSSSSSEDMLGIITLSTSCEHHRRDIASVLGGDCDAFCRGNAGGNPSTTGSLAYILTLGVVDEFRRRGLARELLRRSISHVERTMPHVQAVYLHVVSYNTAAIRLYESMRFVKVGTFPEFYSLHGKPYDSYLYAIYLHSAGPPWKRWFTNLFGLFQWVLSPLNSLWGQQDADTEKPRGGDGEARTGEPSSEEQWLMMP